ncbi:M28 family peptidase [Nitrospira lenta]|uniref:Peptidase, M28 family n=1 Tax=Nitrospira lenta TaxID=1436998 RepID=A0A330L483_9BACT|nr:M28 family peptidase [Nitrospira lenta]SPP64053.1 Peptidase, M28 family [Nitrospira lenta]
MTDEFLTHLAALTRERHPDTSPIALRETASYLSQQFTRVGLDVSTHRFEALGQTYDNVIGTTPVENGTATAPLILAAHYDTVEGSPGADDNASALTVLIEVARRLQQTALTRPVQFVAFCLEEEDLLGSRAYASHLAKTGQSVYGAIVLECVGYASDQEGSQRTPSGIPVAVPSVGNFLALIGNQASAALTAALSQAMAPTIPVVPLVVPGNGEQLPDTRRSDHTAFWEQGFAAVMVTDTANFRNPHYHRSTDTVDTLNLKFLASVADAVTNAVLALAATPERS